MPSHLLNGLPLILEWSDVGFNFFLTDLVTAHPKISHDPKENLDQTIKRLYLAQNESPSIEKRFLAVLEADDDQLLQHLRHLVNLLKAKNLVVDWQLLLQDLISRQHDTDATKRH